MEGLHYYDRATRKKQMDVFVLPKTCAKHIKIVFTHLPITMDAYHCNFIKGSSKTFISSNWRGIYSVQFYDLDFYGTYHKLFDRIQTGALQ